ncbi:MAG: Npt1/Npt2 family nucleotide transporter [Desulfobacterales bacterium]|nr:Npt1/Npt2 family nucleotide transporter [Desulfobacterales bacterium]MDJ0988355.1 Npt1/Npt2 family nucleotide transporter [Desulfobacterales bacterium]
MKPSKLDRFLRLFTDVKPGEGFTAFLMFTNVFLILCAYYFIKPIREGWIAVSDISGLSKMEVKAYSSFGQSIVLIPVVWLYGWLSGRYRRSDLITRSTIFCVMNLAVFWAIQPGLFIEYIPYTGIIFYLWVGIFGVFVVAQFWAFAADVYTMECGNRLFPFIAIGATAGAACGSWITEFLLNSRLIVSESLLIVTMIPLIASIFLSRMVDSHVQTQTTGSQATSVPEIVDSGRSAISIVFASRFLLATALITLLLSWVNTNGENLLFRVVQEFLKGEAIKGGVSDTDSLLSFTRDGTTAFYGNFYFWVNVFALILQAFVASRLLKYGGFGVVLLTMPVIALVSYTAMAFVPILAIVKVMKIAENSTDYSINNTARNVLWLPVSAEYKYKGKPTIDSLFVRVGDGIAAFTVLVGVQFLALSTQSFFVLNIILIFIWILLAFVVIQEHRRYSEPG